MSPRRVVSEKKQSGLPSLIVFIGIVVVAIVVVFVGADLLSQWQLSQQVATDPRSGLKLTGKTEGDLNAPIEFIEYSDFQ